MTKLKSVLLSATMAVTAIPTAGYAADYAAERIDSVERALIFAGVIEAYGDYSLIGDASGNGDNTFGGSSDQDNYFELGASARISMPLGESFSAQLDLDAEQRILDTNDNGHYKASVVSGVHLSYRNPESHLLGVFGGLGQVVYEDDDEADLWFAGVEGQYYFDQVTLYSQIGYLDAKDDADTDALHEAWFVRGVARHFLTDYTMIQADAAYVDGKQDSGSGYDMYGISWGLRLDHQYMSLPVSVFAAYEGNYFDNGSCGDCGDFVEHAFLVGAKFSFGAKDLKQNDRSGATLDLPSFGRWVAAGNEID